VVWLLVARIGILVALPGVARLLRFPELEADQGALAFAPDGGDAAIAVLFDGMRQRHRFSPTHPPVADRKHALRWFPGEIPPTAPMVLLLGWACTSLATNRFSTAWPLVPVGGSVFILSAAMAFGVAPVLLAVWSPLHSEGRRRDLLRFLLLWAGWALGCFVASSEPSVRWLLSSGAFFVAYLPARWLLRAAGLSARGAPGERPAPILVVQALGLAIACALALGVVFATATSRPMVAALAAAAIPIAVLILIRVWRSTQRPTLHRAVALAMWAPLAVALVYTSPTRPAPRQEQILALLEIDSMDDRLAQLDTLFKEDRQVAWQLGLIRLSRVGMKYPRMSQDPLRQACQGALTELRGSPAVAALGDRAQEVCTSERAPAVDPAE
jgi:hypothetical protein